MEKYEISEIHLRSAEQYEQLLRAVKGPTIIELMVSGGAWVGAYVPSNVHEQGPKHISTAF